MWFRVQLPADYNKQLPSWSVVANYCSLIARVQCLSCVSILIVSLGARLFLLEVGPKTHHGTTNKTNNNIDQQRSSGQSTVTC